MQLTRRYDLIPNLVETAKGYMKHERETLEAVITARNSAVSGLKAAAAESGRRRRHDSSCAGAETQLGGALGRLFALAEAYPDLKANQNMMQLSEELTSTENKVAFARQAYNDSVMGYNNQREMFPGSIIAGMFNFTPAQLLEIEKAEAREAPKVSFTSDCSHGFLRPPGSRASHDALAPGRVPGFRRAGRRRGRRGGRLRHRFGPIRGSSPVKAVVAEAASWCSASSCGASLFKTLSLRAGGGRVARSLGGTRIERSTGDIALKRLHNVVEEMSIASGVTMPEVYVLENEDGINAFAAGNSPADAAIAVTRGAITRLKRDELQGVIAHEFSHILNGDMRLNMPAC